MTYNLLVPIGTGTLNPDKPFHAAFTLKASCDLDAAPVKLTLNPARTGPPFLGMGGNFRLQGPADPAPIAYNLANLRVAWARLEMPLSTWQSSETADPAAVPPDKLNSKVKEAMEMARTLAKKQIPYVISDWSAPNWAVAPGGAGGGRQIAPEKWPAMYKGITSYIAYMKKNLWRRAGCCSRSTKRTWGSTSSSRPRTGQGHQGTRRGVRRAGTGHQDAPGRHRQSHAPPVQLH